MNLIYYNSEPCKKEFELSRGKRPWNILLMISAGSFSLTFPERGETHIIEPNEIAFIPANTVFIRRVLTPIDFHQFAFQIEEGPSPTPGKLAIPKEQIAASISSMDRIALLSDHRELILHEIEHLLIQQYLFGQTDPLHLHGVDEDVRKAMRYMKTHMGEKIDMDALAADVYLSHSGLIWKFRRQLGTTPSQYLIMLRLRRAKGLLLEGELSVGEIALQCGYANAYYFTNAFHRYTGMSPTAFRKRYLEK